MKFDGSFSGWLKQRRKALDLTQEELADQVGCAVVTVRKIEQGITRPSKQIAARLADVLAIATEDQADFVAFARRTDQRPMPLNDNNASTHTNLPQFATPFIGRAAEIKEIAVLLEDPNCRLLTLVGPGGIGKTRLAVQAANEKAAQFPDGLYFVELTALGTSEQIVTAIAEAIGVKFAQNTDPKTQLLSAFHTRQMLLLLDNFEHLLDSAPLLTEIQEAAPNVKLLVTSRERLNLSSETLLMLMGMDFAHWETVQEALDYDAAKLFVQSASRAKPNFALLDSDLTALAHICRLVGGMPLGLVLTAAWVAMLSLTEIANELAHSLDFLETEWKDVPARQRNMRHILEQSYRRLDEDEQRVFRHLSIFRGGFTREAAQVVSGASLKTLMSLMNKSLLWRDSTGRYQIHELLRQYADAQLVSMGEVPLAQERHSLYFAHFLHERWEDLKGRRQIAALMEINADFENIRAAWRWLVYAGCERELGEAASSLWFYLTVSVRFYEGVELFSHAVEMLRSLSSPGQEHWIFGHLLGLLADFQGNVCQYEQFEAGVEEALPILRRAGRLEETVMLLLAVKVGVNYGRYEEAYKAAEEAFRIAQTGENAWIKRRAKTFRASQHYFRFGAPPTVNEVLEIYREEMALSLSAGDIWHSIEIGIKAAYVALAECKFQEAEMFCRAAIEGLKELHGLSDYGPYVRLGASLAQQGRDAEAKLYLHQGIKIVYDWGVIRDTLVYILMTIENYFLQRDEPFSVELLGMILKHPACDSVVAGWTEKTIKVLKADLSAQVYDAAWKRGEQWTLDQAVGLVLAHLSAA